MSGSMRTCCVAKCGRSKICIIMDGKYLAEYPLNKTGDGEKYVLSLDSIDLNLLKTYKFQSGHQFPTWGNRDKDFQQFEVYVRCDNGYDDEYETYTCHICCIEVPVVFAHDHECSDTHVAATQIAAAVLKRMQLQLLQPARQERSLDIRERKSLSNVYFCKACCKLIKKSDKNRHDASIEHNDFKNKESKIMELCNIYTGSGSTKSVNANTHIDLETEKHDKADDIVSNEIITETNAEAVTSKGVNDNISYWYGIDESNIEKDFQNETTNFESTKTMLEHVNNKEDSKMKQNPVESYSIETFEGLFDDNMKESVKNSKGEIVHYITYEKQNFLNGNKVKIEALSGAKVVVPLDNYRGEYRTSNGVIQCRVCRQVVTSEILHLMSKEHKEKILVPIKDRHFLRELDEGLHHCILCNEVVAEVGLHILLNPQHTDNLKKVILPLENNVPTETKKKHPKEITKEQRNEINKHKGQLKITRGKKQIKCKICKVVVPSFKQINFHIRSNGHVQKCKDILAKNYMTPFGDKYYCTICACHISSINHYRKKIHKQNLRKFTITQNTSNDSKILNTYRTESELMSEAGPSGWNTISMENTYDFYEDDISSNDSCAEGSDTYNFSIVEKEPNCNVHMYPECNEELSNIEKDIGQHENINRYEQNLLKKEYNDDVKQNYCLGKDKIDLNELTTVIEKNLDNNTLSTDEELFSVSRRIEVKNSLGEIVHYISFGKEYYEKGVLGIKIEALSGAKVVIPLANYEGSKRNECIVCDRDTSWELVHFMFKEHKKKIDTPIRDRHFLRELDEGLQHCILCNEIVSDVEFHISLTPHKDNLKKVILPLENNYRHETEVKHLSEIKEKQKPQLNKLNGPFRILRNKHIKCNVCDIIVANDEIDSHIVTTEHVQKYKHTLATNYITQNCDKFYCKVCNIDTSTANHYRRQKHKENLKEFNKTIAQNSSNDLKTPNTENVIPIKSEMMPEAGTSTGNTMSMKNMYVNEDGLAVRVKVPNFNVHMCPICNVEVPNNKNNIEQHEKGNRHKQNWLEYVTN